MVSCTEFIPLYSELFKWLEAQGGKKEVIKYWEHVSENYVEPMLGTLVKRDGIKGCYEYWSKSLNEEACDFVMSLDEENGVFEIQMNGCPSRGMLNKLTYTQPYNDYCGHCGLLYSRVCEKYGLIGFYDFNGIEEAKCVIKIIDPKIYTEEKMTAEEKKQYYAKIKSKQVVGQRN